MSWDFNNPSGLGGDAANGGEFATSGSPTFDWVGASTSIPEAQGGSAFGWPAGNEAGSLSDTMWSGDTGFIDPNGPTLAATPLPPGSPPVPWIAGAAASAVVALAGALVAAFVLSGSVPVAAASWVLAGPAAVLLLGEFVKRDERQRARAFYEGDWARPVSIAVGVVALLAVGVAAYVIADWVATR